MKDMYYIIENDMELYFHSKDAMERYKDTGDTSTIIWQQPVNIQKYKDDMMI